MNASTGIVVYVYSHDSKGYDMRGIRTVLSLKPLP